jgi:TRAP-type C4-dicarboxylate transport system permease small subunit
MTEGNSATRHASDGMARVSTHHQRRWIAIWFSFSRAIKALNFVCGLIAGLLIMISAAVITNEVIWRYYLRRPHTWNLEFNIFLLIGATFIAANYAQMKRAHVGTEVLQSLMPASWNRIRILGGDVLSVLLCAFMAVKVWQYSWQAWNEGWATNSTWAPPLWIPYSLIGAGLALISLEYFVQIVEEIATGGREGKINEPA